MKYMLMMQGTKKDMEGFGSLTPEEIRAHIEYMGRLDQDLRDSGELVIDEGLAPPDQAKIVTAQHGGPPVVSDGPFPEAKEFLAGFWIVDVESPERAIEIAERASSAPGSGGEPLNIPILVHPVGEAPGEEM